jgi:hypothetical protein
VNTGRAAERAPRQEERRRPAAAAQGCEWAASGSLCAACQPRRRVAGAYYDTKEQRLIEIFKTNTETGLTRAEVTVRADSRGWWPLTGSGARGQERQAKYGLNLLPTSPKESLWIILLRQFQDFIIIVRAHARLSPASLRPPCQFVHGPPLLAPPRC